jgi:hypothetical protein
MERRAGSAERLRFNFGFSCFALREQVLRHRECGCTQFVGERAKRVNAGAVQSGKRVAGRRRRRAAELGGIKEGPDGDGLSVRAGGVGGGGGGFY